MLDPAFTFARPHPDPQSATLPPDSRLVARRGLEKSPRRADLAGSLPSAGHRGIRTGAVDFWKGDKGSHVFHVLEGCLRLYRIMQDGRRAILGFSYAGEFLGVSFRKIYRSRRKP